MIKNPLKEDICYEKYNCFGNSIFLIPVDNKKVEKKETQQKKKMFYYLKIVHFLQTMNQMII